MKSIINDFLTGIISPSSTFRTILLFGRNVSTYKFALADTLLKASTVSYLKYNDLRDDFLKSLYEHYKNNPYQYQAGENSLTRAFDQYTLDYDWNNLVSVAEKNIYNNVFDAFHNVGGSSIKSELILFEHDKINRRIVVTEKMHEILENTKLSAQLLKECQSRWLIVEEAWRNKISPNLLIYDNDNNIYSVSTSHERVNLRSALDILLPYQQSRCFYCNKIMDPGVDSLQYSFPDVDHLIPHSAFNRVDFLDQINPNGIWNLVLACHECNRGPNGKFDSPPDKIYYEKLIMRNKLFTQEHRHSLKNTILLSIGASNHIEVEAKMNSFKLYIDMIIGWKPKRIYYD